MAKKRKLANSTSVPETEPEHEPESEPEPEPEPSEEEEEEEESEPSEEEVDEEEKEEEEEEKEEEEEEEMEEEEEEEEGEEEEEDEEEEEEKKPPSTAANGSGSIPESAVRELLLPFRKDQLISLLASAALSHSSVLRSIESAAATDPNHRTLVVCGFRLDATYASLRSFFGKYGELEDVDIVTDKRTRCRTGSAYVVFKNRAAAQKALLEPNKKIGDRVISYRLAAFGPPRVGSAAVAVPASAQVAKADNTQRKIYVSNIGPRVDPKKLLDFFAKFGEIERGPLGMEFARKKPNGFVIFIYKTVEGAKRVLEQPNKHFQGTLMHCWGESEHRSTATNNNRPNNEKVQMFKNNHLAAPAPQQATAHPVTNNGSKNGKVQMLRNDHLVPPNPHQAAQSAVPAAGVGYSQPAAATPAPPAVNAGLNPAVGQVVGEVLSALGLTNLLGGLGGAVANQGVQAPVANAAVPRVQGGYAVGAQAQGGYGAGAQAQGGYGAGTAVPGGYGAGTGLHSGYGEGTAEYGGYAAGTAAQGGYWTGTAEYGAGTGVQGRHGAGRMEYSGHGAAQSGYRASPHVQGGYGSPVVGQGGAGRGYPQGGYGYPGPYR